MVQIYSNMNTTSDIAEQFRISRVMEKAHLNSILLVREIYDSEQATKCEDRSFFCLQDFEQSIHKQSFDIKFRVFDRS